MLPNYKMFETMFGKLMTCWVLVSVIINCQACAANPLTGSNVEGQSNSLKTNQAAYQGSNGNWMPWHENPLFQRYHAPGTDFSGRIGYPKTDGIIQDEIKNYKATEVRYRKALAIKINSLLKYNNLTSPVSCLNFFNF